ncbi:amino acid adenylation domain-containing protein (plasmid) [Streptomyces sp. NBC_00868]|uniref:amino acid adenylation domain-containing protein n=1 Tax=Streptomyces sp. NBC_00868 TaxID=2903683 RepID=UPI002F90EF49|nr:amino acid adenylation domain-containing protein [Streptomyces sp. NBC_00868]
MTSPSSLLAADEARRALRAERPVSLPADVCVHEVFERRVAETPGATAITTDTHTLTYGELNSRANRLAHHLRTLGITPGTPVGLCLERTPDQIVALLAVLKSGGAYVPLDPAYPTDRLALMLDDTAAPVVLTHTHLAHQLPDTGARRILLDTTPLDQHPTTNPTPTATPTDLAYIIYTSGSTGRPKGVMIEHRGLVNYLGGVLDLVLPTGPVTSLLHSSLNFDFSVTSLYTPLLTGGVLRLAPHDVSNEDLATRVQDGQLDLVRLTPSHVEVLATALCGKEGLEGPGILLIGGEVLRAHHLTKLRRLFPGTTVYNHYGPAEAVVGRCVMRLDESAGFDLDRYTSHDALPVGHPLPGTELVIAPTQDGATGPHTGELLIGGAGLARGYLNLPQETERRFLIRDGQRMYRTGDLATLDDRQRIVITGRADGQVKVRGYRVEPREVEAHAAELAGVQGAAALVPPGHEGLTLFVVPAPGAVIVPAELRRRLAGKLPHFMVPGQVIELAELPLTKNGKLDRATLGRLVEPLPAADPSDPAEEGSLAAPATGGDAAQLTADIVRRAWTEALNLPDIVDDDNFLELGGDSISAMRVGLACRQAGLEISSRDVLLSENLAELVESATESAPARQAPAPAADNSGAPLTPIQEWFFALPLKNRNVYNQSVVVHPGSGVSARGLRAALDWLVDRHDALRLRFSGDARNRRQHAARPGDDSLLEEVSWNSDQDGACLEEYFRAADEAMDIGARPLLRAMLLRDTVGRHPVTLLLTAHHLAVDTMSWNVLLDELATAYRQCVLTGRIQEPAPLYSFLDWARVLRDRRGTDSLAAQEGYWAAHTATGALPLTPSTYGESRTRELCFDAGTTAALRRYARRNGLRADTPLLTAVLRATGLVLGTRTVSVALESHGRLDEWTAGPVAAGVGWFTSLYAQRFPVSPAGDFTAQARTVDRQLGDVPDFGLGHGLDPSGRRTADAPGISFNFLGSLHAPRSLEAAGWRVADWWRWYRDPENTRPYALEITGAVIDERLVVRVTGAGGGSDAPYLRIADEVERTLKTLAADDTNPMSSSPNGTPTGGQA